MTREDYPCRQDPDGSDPLADYDPRRGQNDDAYFAWLREVLFPPLPDWYWEGLRDLHSSPALYEWWRA